MTIMQMYGKSWVRPAISIFLTVPLVMHKPKKRIQNTYLKRKNPYKQFPIRIEVSKLVF